MAVSTKVVSQVCSTPDVSFEASKKLYTLESLKGIKQEKITLEQIAPSIIV